MTGEAMDSGRDGDYDAMKSQNIRRRIGEYLARHFRERDEYVGRNTRDGGLESEAVDVVKAALDDEFASAIARAELLLDAVAAGEVPSFLRAESWLHEAYPDEVQQTVTEWAAKCEQSLGYLREDTQKAIMVRAAIEDESRMRYCIFVSQAETGLRNLLERRFNGGRPTSTL